MRATDEDDGDNAALTFSLSGKKLPHRKLMGIDHYLLKAGLHVRRKHKHKHKPRVDRDDASTSTSARSFFLCLRRPGSHMAYACAFACACVVRVNQPFVFSPLSFYYSLKIRFVGACPNKAKWDLGIPTAGLTSSIASGLMYGEVRTR